MRRLFAFLYFFFHFLFVFIKANMTVAKLVLFVPRHRIHGRMFYVEGKGLAKWELFLFAHLITLTPGTTCVEVELDPHRLLIHAMSEESDEEIQESLQKDILQPLLGFMR